MINPKDSFWKNWFIDQNKIYEKITVPDLQDRKRRMSLASQKTFNEPVSPGAGKRKVGSGEEITIPKNNQMKLSIFDCREYEFTAKDGRDIHGYMYSAFAEGGPIQFSSANGKHKVYALVKFDPKQSEEIAIRPSLFDGKLKYREDLEA